MKLGCRRKSHKGLVSIVSYIPYDNCVADQISRLKTDCGTDGALQSTSNYLSSLDTTGISVLGGAAEARQFHRFHTEFSILISGLDGCHLSCFKLMIFSFIQTVALIINVFLKFVLRREIWAALPPWRMTNVVVMAASVTISSPHYTQPLTLLDRAAGWRSAARAADKRRKNWVVIKECRAERRSPIFIASLLWDLVLASLDTACNLHN